MHFNCEILYSDVCQAYITQGRITLYPGISPIFEISRSIFSRIFFKPVNHPSQVQCVTPYKMLSIPVHLSGLKQRQGRNHIIYVSNFTITACCCLHSKVHIFNLVALNYARLSELIQNV